MLKLNSFPFKFGFIAIVFWLNQPLSVSAQATNTDKIPSKSEIISLISRSSDGPPDENEIARHQKLVNMGAKAYPVLCAELVGTDDPFYASHILSIFIESNGDKSAPRLAIAKLINKWNSRSTNGRSLLGVSAQVLGKIGTKEDAPVLLLLLNDSDSAVRVNALRSLAKVGDEQTAQKVQAWAAARKASLSEMQQLRDPSIKEAEKTATAVKARLQKRGTDQ